MTALKKANQAKIGTNSRFTGMPLHRMHSQQAHTPQCPLLCQRGGIDNTINNDIQTLRLLGQRYNFLSRQSNSLSS